MSRDRSLDEFSSGASEGSAASEADGEGPKTEAELDVDEPSESDSEADADSDTGNREADTDTDTDDAPPESPDDVEPAAVTYRWDPGGVGCAECGATVDRLWSGESGQVCAECKEW